VESIRQGSLAQEEGKATVRMADGTLIQAEVHWYEAHGVGSKESRSSVSSTDMKEREHQLVVCVRNDENPASLELRKIYELIPDPKAMKLNLVRIIDESGEDYLYPINLFVPIKLPQATGRAILRARYPEARPR
jgi:hypothetical protein